MATLSLETKKRDMQAEGELASDEDVKITMLAELQMKQDQEVAHTLGVLSNVVSHYCTSTVGTAGREAGRHALR